MKRILSLLFITLTTFSSFAQDYFPSTETAQQLLQRRGEVFFRFSADDLQNHPELFMMISIDKVTTDQVYAYANTKEFNAFQKLNIGFTALVPPSEMIEVAMADSPQQALEWNYYPTYSQYESIMADFAADNPDIAQLIEIGTLPSGRKLLAIRITDNPEVQENEPEFFYSSSMHGDELAGYPMMLHLIDLLLTGYGTDTRITDIVNATDIFINPLANPDGTYKGGNNTVYGATRGNANNIDFNRNFPDPEPIDPGNPSYDHMHPDGHAWQPETVAFMNFAAAQDLTLSANFHGGAEVLNYPWDTWARLAPDDAWWIHVCRQYADTVHKYAPSNYMNEFDNGITNGYAWYRITGGRQDYHNYFIKEREVTIELSDTKLIPASQLIPHWNYNYRSLINFIEQSHYGIHGTVTDSLTGEPLYAKIFINGHDADSSFIYTDPDVGDYHRLIKAGSYSVTYSAPGYLSKTYTITVADMATKIQNVQLYDGSLYSNFKANKTSIPVDGTVNFQDQSAGNPLTWNWSFEGGTPAASDEQNPVVVYKAPGQYDVTLTVTRSDGSDSQTKEGYITVQPWYMYGNNTYEVCEGLFLDQGGLLGSYANLSDYHLTFKPDSELNRLKVHFNSMNIEPGTNCNKDKLVVYNGADLTDPVIATYCGTDIPQDVISLNEDNALTFRFISNDNTTYQGWEAVISCVSTLDTDSPVISDALVVPNPSHDGIFRLQKTGSIFDVIVLNSNGVQVSSEINVKDSFTIDLSGYPSGIYLALLRTSDGTERLKLIKD